METNLAISLFSNLSDLLKDCDAKLDDNRPNDEDAEDGAIDECEDVTIEQFTEDSRQKTFVDEEDIVEYDDGSDNDGEDDSDGENDKEAPILVEQENPFPTVGNYKQEIKVNGLCELDLSCSDKFISFEAIPILASYSETRVGVIFKNIGFLDEEISNVLSNYHDTIHITESSEEFDELYLRLIQHTIGVESRILSPALALDDQLCLITENMEVLEEEESMQYIFPGYQSRYSKSIDGHLFRVITLSMDLQNRGKNLFFKVEI